jgi:translation elongation factor EF-G
MTCAMTSVREAFAKGAPCILEPVMSVEVIAPSEFQGRSPGVFIYFYFISI